MFSMTPVRPCAGFYIDGVSPAVNRPSFLYPHIPDAPGSFTAEAYADEVAAAENAMDDTKIDYLKQRIY